MSAPRYSDEPRLIKPAATDSRFLAFIAVIVVLLIALASGIGLHFYHNWQEDQAHDAERGTLGGAVYVLDIDGQNRRLELGWAGDRLAVALNIPNPDEVTVYVKGSFGSETLRKSEITRPPNLFGPTQAQVNPFKHYHLDIRIERNGHPLWSGKLWAWGIHQHHHHH